MNLKRLGVLLLCGMLVFTVSMCGCTSKTVADEVNPSSASGSNPTVAEKSNTVENKEEVKYKTIKDMWGREVKIKKDVKMLF